MKRHVLLPCALALALVTRAPTVAAQQKPPANANMALAESSQNPVGDLLSIPFQFNWFSRGGLGTRSLRLLNFQPLLPFSIGKDWNMVARTIVPFVNAPGPGLTRISGMGDILQQFFITPSHASPIIWGAGPVLSMPTATNDLFVTGQWAAGPALALLTIQGPWVIGVLNFQIWKFAGENLFPDISSYTVQPFINFNFGDGWAISTAPLITANWNALNDDDRWTVPIGVGLSKVGPIGRQPMSLGIQYYHNVERPEFQGSDQVRIFAALLFPTQTRP